MFDMAEPTFSQSGEDRIAWYLFNYFSKSGIQTYLDVGTADPIGHNNTYLSYCQGASGVLVEADPKYAETYRKLRARDTSFSVAVVPSRLCEAGFVQFYVANEPGLSTAKPENAEYASKHNGINKIIDVPCVTLNKIVNENFQNKSIDLLSIDVEGFDYELLEEFDYERHAPKVIIAENVGGNPIHRDLLISKGYDMYAFTNINTIYAKRSDFVYY